MAPDTFDTLVEQHRASLKIQRSEFLGIVVPLAREEEFAPLLQGIEKEFFDATHHCWAWRLFDGGQERSRSSDAGEPSGTAGKPILQALVSAELFDVAAIVVRYYGGVKLGTGGLARAYRDAAQEAAAGAQRITRYLYDEVAVEVPFRMLNEIYRLIAPPDILLKGEEFGEPNVFTFRVRRSRVDAFRDTLTRLRLTLR